MSKIYFPEVQIQIDSDVWDDLIRQFSVENQYEGFFLAKDFLELTVSHPSIPSNSADAALLDNIDFIQFSVRQSFSSALRKKYRIGSEFARSNDAQDVFDKIFLDAEHFARNTLNGSDYTFDTLIYIEIFYWSILQALRAARGEYLDRRSQGNQVRLGESLDLAEDEELLF